MNVHEKPRSDESFAYAVAELRRHENNLKSLRRAKEKEDALFAVKEAHLLEDIEIAQLTVTRILGSNPELEEQYGAALTQFVVVQQGNAS
ncbi:MAG: hypothetical protein KDE45_00165 [Caldilineaceae bacterium]|nr:hypothetical protein [Caldilineaceae bacterium]